MNPYKIISAGDGSINKKKYLSFIFYTISAETITYDKNMEKIENSFIDITPPHKFLEDRIRNYMEIYEYKNALKTIKTYNPDYYLFDGSVMGSLIRPLPLEKELPTNIKKEIIKDYKEPLIKEIKKGLVNISSLKFKDKLKKYKDSNTALMFLESIETLLVIKEILEYKKKIIGISKTSTSKDYFKQKIPDMVIFDSIHENEGYSKPYSPKVSEKQIKHEYNVENEYFKNQNFSIFYTRLEKNRNILKFEVPYELDTNKIEELINIIKPTCAEGYPYLLKKAHNDVVIKKTDIEQLVKIIGIHDKNGREML
jgi:NurA-like 5'-3' nuclease